MSLASRSLARANLHVPPVGEVDEVVRKGHEPRKKADDEREGDRLFGRSILQEREKGKADPKVASNEEQVKNLPPARREGLALRIAPEGAR